jgi:hypothetical protein
MNRLPTDLQPEFEDADNYCNLILSAISLADFRETSACSA